MIHNTIVLTGKMSNVFKIRSNLEATWFVWFWKYIINTKICSYQEAADKKRELFLFSPKPKKAGGCCCYNLWVAPFDQYFCCEGIMILRPQIHHYPGSENFNAPRSCLTCLRTDGKKKNQYGFESFFAVVNAIFWIPMKENIFNCLSCVGLEKTFKKSDKIILLTGLV